MGDPEVAYFSRTGFLSKFLEHSYEEDLSDRIMRVYTPCVVAGALLTAVVYGLLSGGTAWLAAVTIFCSVLCVASPVAAVTAVNLPLLRACRKILRRGGMLANWPAAEEFGDLHALAVDALEVFPSESVMLHGIKTFSGTRIDEAILDAASICIRAGGPLSSVFRRIIENKLDILQEVDTLVYEQEMGLSGWVNGRRVLVGTRRLLENHGVDVPSRDYEKRYTKAGERQLVYLSIAGDLSAMFVISYVADEGIAQALQGLTKRGLTLLVRTCDPNITEELICSVYGVDGYYVEVLGASAGRSYEKLVRRSSDEEEAGLASNGRLEGMAVALSHCSRLRTGGILSVVIQVIGGILGFALSVFIAFYTKQAFPPLYAIAYLAGWALLTWIVPILFRKT
jgi:Cu+-exporting ATPase